MSFDLEQMLRSKKAFRERLSRLPIGEKLRLLDAMRERALVIRGATLREASTVQEKPARYGGRKGEKQ